MSLGCGHDALTLVIIVIDLFILLYEHVLGN